MSYSVVIAEDEKLSADLLEIILSELEGESLCVKHVAHSGEEAIAAVIKHKPDILFLDINMPQGDGFAVVDALYNHDFDMPAIIFTTAHSRFAVRAFDVEAADYLLKPLSNERVGRAVQKVMKAKAAASDNILVSAPLATLKVPTKDGAEFISIAHIDVMEASGDYIYIHTDDRKLMMRGTLRDYSQKFSRQFYQTHRSYLINIDSVKAIHRKTNGGATILMKHGATIPLSRRYKAGLLDILADMI